MGLCRGAVPPLTVCLPVRMGTVSACDWMPVLALRSGWSLRCRTASEWRGRGGVAREAFRVGDVCGLTGNECKGSVCGI